jgi:hypothetical protein
MTFQLVFGIIGLIYTICGMIYSFVLFGSTPSLRHDDETGKVIGVFVCTTFAWPFFLFAYAVSRNATARKIAKLERQYESYQ